MPFKPHVIRDGDDMLHLMVGDQTGVTLSRWGGKRRAFSAVVTKRYSYTLSMSVGREPAVKES